MQFAVERVVVDGRPVLRVRGELDIATAPAFAASVEGALADGPREVVVDLSGTTFLDSSGCRQLAVSARQASAGGARMSVACPAANTAVRRVLDFLELQALVPVVEVAPTSAT